MGVVDENRDDRSEHHHENGEEFIFLRQEGHGTTGNRTVDKFQPVPVFLIQSKVKRHIGHFLHIKESNTKPQ